MRYLFATTNKAKIRRYATQLIERGIEVVSLDDLDLKIDVDENGNSPIENAIIKAAAYNRVSGIPTIAIDEGLFLNGVPDEIQPGTHVRRVNGKRLDDREMIEHYIGLVNRYGTDGKLQGYFTKGVAIVNGKKKYTYEYKADRSFANEQSEKIDEGYPLASIQMVQQFGKYKSELSEEEERIITKQEVDSIVEFIISTIKEIEGQTKEER